MILGKNTLYVLQSGYIILTLLKQHQPPITEEAMVSIQDLEQEMDQASIMRTTLSVGEYGYARKLFETDPEEAEAYLMASHHKVLVLNDEYRPMTSEDVAIVFEIWNRNA